MDTQQKQIFSKEQEIMLTTLAESVAKPGCKFLEVGSWCGDSTVILGKIAQKNGGHLFCVDWWKGNIGTELVTIAKENDIFSLFWKNICSFGLEDVVIPIRTKSDIATTILKEQTFDFIFLDGDHRFEAILSDIKEYSPLAKKGNSVLCGHDCDGYIPDFDADLLEKGKNRDVYKGIHCGVVLAVGTAFKEYSVDHNIWSVRAPSENLDWQRTNLGFCVPQLLERYNRFNLIKYFNNIYALDSTLGPIDLTKDKEILNKYQEGGKCIIGKSVEEVKFVIEQGLCVVPKLIEEGYKHFNIILYKDKHYALEQSLGQIDFSHTKEEKLQAYQEQGKCFIADSFKEAKAFIDQLNTFFVPKLIEEAYGGFNIIYYKNKYYAMAQEIGSIDFYRIKQSKIEAYKKQEKCFISGSLYEVKYLVAQKSCQRLERELIQKQENIQKLELNIEEIKVDICGRDQKLDSFAKELTRRDKSINEFNAAIADLNNKIETFKKDISRKDEIIANLKNDIGQKDENLAKLTQNIEAYNTKIKLLESNLSDKDKTIADLKKDISGKDNIIARLNTNINSLNNEIIKPLQEEIIEKNNSIERLMETLRVLQEKYKTLAEDMKAQSEYLQGCQRILREIQAMGFLKLFYSKLTGKLGKK